MIPGRMVPERSARMVLGKVRIRIACVAIRNLNINATVNKNNPNAKGTQQTTCGTSNNRKNAKTIKTL